MSKQGDLILQLHFKYLAEYDDNERTRKTGDTTQYLNQKWNMPEVV